MEEGLAGVEDAPDHMSWRTTTRKVGSGGQREQSPPTPQIDLCMGSGQRDRESLEGRQHLLTSAGPRQAQIRVRGGIQIVVAELHLSGWLETRVMLNKPFRRVEEFTAEPDWTRTRIVGVTSDPPKTGLPVDTFHAVS